MVVQMEIQEHGILNHCDVVLPGAEYMTCQYQRTMLSPIGKHHPSSRRSRYAVCAQSLSPLILCDTMDCSLPGSTVMEFSMQ